MDHTAIVSCDPATDKAALALASRAWPAAEESAYRQAIDESLTRNRGEKVVLLAARSDDKLIAAQLAQLIAGRAALVWPPQFSPAQASDDSSLASALFSRLTAELASAGARFAQGLLAVNDEDRQRLYLSGGFSHGGDLLYLTADASHPLPAVPPLPFETEPFCIGDERRLASLIERTYVGTLDCPKLDGLRQTADVIEGYKAIGDFRPHLWLFARHQERDVGCLLINMHPDVRHAEIVYVAFTPEVRGRGWGAELTRFAQRLAHAEGAERLVLAVDAANQPAIRIYEALGFIEFDRRSVWIRALPENSNSR